MRTRFALQTTLAFIALTIPIIALGDGATMTIDPATRHFHIAYRVPENAPETVTVTCRWRHVGQEDWQVARVTPLLTETALALLAPGEPDTWEQGVVTERRAAGIERTIVFNPYPDAQVDGKVNVEFELQIAGPDGAVLQTERVALQADNSDVVYIEDWSQVLQRDDLAENPAREDRKWNWTPAGEQSQGASLGNSLSVISPPDVGARPITYPLDLKGHYLIYVCNRARYGIDLRLSGDERADGISSRFPWQEVLWRWARMDRQHLVLQQPHAYTGYCTGQIDYVKFVPISDEQAKSLNARLQGPQDRLVAGYWEPYSWAFSENIRSTLQHREPLVAFAEARIGIVDTQVGRFGMKMVYETRLTDQLLYSTQGDPIGHVANPTTDNVGRMQQYTNTLDATLRYCRELGMGAHANFGATNCYPGSPLQGNFSKEHPEWMRGHALRYEVPEVRQYILSLYRETLEIGAEGISIDYCRYPEGIDVAETCNAFLRELRALADEFGQARGRRVPVLVRFPAHGVRMSDRFDYVTWCKEGLVDYLCPSNIQGRHMNFDVTPYLEATRGTGVMLLPVVDALSWGLPFAGPFLQRVDQLYKAGCPGVYIYQADGRILARNSDRRVISILPDSAAVSSWCEHDRAMRLLCTKNIYITPYHQEPGYHGWERIRIWVEGVPDGPMEVYLDDKLVNTCDGPPYLVGTEANESDGVIPSGDHVLRIRVKDGDGWLERSFNIHGA